MSGDPAHIFSTIGTGQPIDDPGVGVVSLAGLRRELTELLGAAVDVVPDSTLKPGVRDQILAEAIAL
jgi:predicted nucleotidyltransferase